MRTRDTRLTVTLYTRTGRGEVTQSEERERKREGATGLFGFHGLQQVVRFKRTRLLMTGHTYKYHSQVVRYISTERAGHATWMGLPESGMGQVTRASHKLAGWSNQHSPHATSTPNARQCFDRFFALLLVPSDFLVSLLDGAKTTGSSSATRLPSHSAILLARSAAISSGVGFSAHERRLEYLSCTAALARRVS